MKRTFLFRKILSVAFATAIVFTVSVRETHYLFSHTYQEIHEHCENHLHDSSHSHSDCNVCKFDVSLFTDAIVSNSFTQFVSVIENLTEYYQFFKLQKSALTLSLRGPPVLG